MTLCVPMGSVDPAGGGGLWVLDREASRLADSIATDRFGIPSIALMEHASLGLRERALAMLSRSGLGRAVVLAGTGNNGGDGFALARHLANEGVGVHVLLAGDERRCSADAACNLRAAREMGVPIEHATGPDPAGALRRRADGGALLVDALLGTGLRTAARPPHADLIGAINSLAGPAFPVLSVDVPSGLDCDTGAPPEGGVAVFADETVTFLAAKPGYLSLDAQRWTGEVWVAGIGAPRVLVEELGRWVETRRPDPTRAGGRARPAERPPGRARSGPAAPD